MALPGLEEDMEDDAPDSEPSAKDSMGMMRDGPMMGGMRDDFTAAAEEAFPEIAGDPTRIEALKSAIRICLEEDEAGGYGGDEKKKGKPGGFLAAVFSGPKGPKKD